MLRHGTHTILPLLMVVVALGASPGAHPLQPKAESDSFDVIHYQIDAELHPEESFLTGKTSVTVKLLAATRSLVFEMNGSLVVSSVRNEADKPLDFLQDRLDRLDLRVDLGETLSAGTELKLTAEYKGALRTPEGGPVLDRRLAYIGTDGSYLFYAARWFPFHKYASDLATYEIRLTVPQGLSVAGYTQSPGPPVPARKGYVTHTLVSQEQVLPGSLAVGNYITRSIILPNGLTLEAFVRPGDEGHIEQFSSTVSRILEVYSARFGSFPFGQRMQIVEIDDESLEYYSGPGTIFIAARIFSERVPFDAPRLAREVAYQWWGQAVTLSRFDDAWLSQGLAQFSSLLFRQETGSAIEFEQAVNETMERALTFESTASIARAPAELYDLSPSYISIVYYKGAFVFHMLRTLIGDEKFFPLLRAYFQTFRGRAASIPDFESLATQFAGRSVRGFFGMWVDSTGVPEFRVEYLILRTREGTFKVRGTLRQNYDVFEMPVELLLRAEGQNATTTIPVKGTEATFEMASESLPLEVIVDPNNKILHVSEEIKVNVVVRRGIEHLRNREYPEAEQEFRAAIELDPQNSWPHYNLGLLYFEQRNCLKALDAFQEAINGTRQPSWVVVWSHIYRGNCYDANDERERAVAEYQKAVDLGDDYNGAQKTAQEYLSKPFKYL